MSPPGVAVRAVRVFWALDLASFGMTISFTAVPPSVALSDAEMAYDVPGAGTVQDVECRGISGLACTCHRARVGEQSQFGSWES